jgi:hypothetical protein
MRSIYEQVLGPDFARLHPEIQRRFGFSSKDNTAAIGTGVMEELWHGPAYTLPFLYVGAWRRIDQSMWLSCLCGCCCRGAAPAHRS